jgi:hypothetical protein
MTMSVTPIMFGFYALLAFKSLVSLYLIQLNLKPSHSLNMVECGRG